MHSKRIVYYLRRRKKIRKDKEVRPREKEKFKKKKKIGLLNGPYNFQPIYKKLFIKVVIRQLKTNMDEFSKRIL